MKWVKTMVIIITLFLASHATNTTIIPLKKAYAESPVLSITSTYNLTQQYSTFLVNITVSDVTKLNLWLVNLTFDPEHIQITTGGNKGIQYPRKTGPFYNIFEGDFIKNVSSTYFFISSAQGGKISNETGELYGLACMASTGGASGSGVLAIINFTLLRVGTSQINITGSVLQSVDGSSITHSVVNGVVSDKPPPAPPVPPIWTQTWFHGTLIAVGVVVGVVGIYKKFGKKIKQRRLSIARESEPIYEEHEPTFD